MHFGQLYKIKYSLNKPVFWNTTKSKVKKLLCYLFLLASDHWRFMTLRSLLLQCSETLWDLPALIYMNNCCSVLHLSTICTCCSFVLNNSTICTWGYCVLNIASVCTCHSSVLHLASRCTYSCSVCSVCTSWWLVQSKHTDIASAVAFKGNMISSWLSSLEIMRERGKGVTK